MTVIKFSDVVSVSSEDESYPAANLLKDDEYKQWKCDSGGLGRVSVILQFEKSSKINGVDIGNCGSAFVEVLVGRMSDNDSNYQVLLVASSFMSPLESRNGSNANRVRLFGTHKLCKEALEGNWDRAKIVCTQPYNKTVQFGLSFIKFHSPSESHQVETKKTVSVGAFVIREETVEPTLEPGSLFTKKRGTAHVSGTLEVRQASLKEESLILRAKKSPILSCVSEKKTVTTTTPTTSTSTLQNIDAVVSGKRKLETASSQKKRVCKEVSTNPSISSLMSGVTFALSGFVNPLRHELRDKAAAMGAIYKPDWDVSCTHLICAFPNTPKFDMVKRLNGNIITKEWILDSHKNKKLMPWRDYNMRKDNATSAKKKNAKVRSVEENQQNNEMKLMDEELADDYDGSTDVDSDLGKNDSNTDVDSDLGKHDSDTEIDTDEEMQNNLVKHENSRHRKMVASDVTLDAEISRLGLSQLPDYFGGLTFFLYGDFEDAERRLLLRYITAFNGKQDNYMSENVDFIVSLCWDDEFYEVLKSNKNLIVIKPQWIFECARKRKLLPFQPFTVA